MKKFLAAAVLAGLATAAFAQSQVDASIAFQAPDLNAAPANKSTTTGDQKSTKANNIDSVVKYTYTAKLDDANTLKFGGSVDVYTPFYVGTGKLQSQYAAAVFPFVQYQGYGLDVQTNLGIYTFGPADAANVSAGVNALGFYTGPMFSGTKLAQDNKTPVSNYVKASYKYSVDKTLAFVAGIETDSALAPVFFLVDAKPQASVIWTFLQLDAKYNLTFKTTDADKADKTTTQTYLEPKLTADLSSFADVLKGLKLYTAAKVILADTAANAKLKGTRWDNGVAYSFTLKDVGTFGFDTYFRAGNIGPDATSNDTQYDYNLKATYTVKF